MAVGTTVQVTLPQMGESVSEGTVLEWHAAEGDTVAADETLVEVSTDKVDAEVPSPASGTVMKIHAQEGETIAVGAVLAEIDTNGGGDAPAGASDGNGAAPAAEPQAPPTDEAKALDIVMPQMGESVTEGTVLEWHKQAGDAVAADETIVEISTDKVDAEVPSPAAGTITEVLAEAGDTVEVGQVLARMTTSGAAATAAAPEAAPAEAGARVGAGRARGRRPRRGAPPPAAAPEAAPAEAAPAAATPIAQPNGGDVSPVARRVAAAEGIDLSGVAGTGPRGRITKADV